MTDIEEILVPAASLQVGDWFWDSDGDLNYVTATVATREDDDGNEYEDDEFLTARYWSKYKEADGFPDSPPDVTGETWPYGEILTWSKEYEFTKIMLFQPVNEDELAETLASIKEALK